MSAKTNPIDDNKQGLIGKPLDRVDGPIKVAGTAAYAYEYNLPELEKISYGYIVGSSIAKGRITSVDTSDAENAAGVLLVLTYKNSPKMGASKPDESPLEKAKPYLNSQDIHYIGEPVALIVAETFEEARNAAKLIKVSYSKDDSPRFNMEKGMETAEDPKKLGQGDPSDSKIGDFETAFADAAVKVDSTYTTPYYHSVPMELHAAMAVWQGDKVTVYSAHQMPNMGQESIAKTFEIPKENVRIICKYVGGGFGSKLDTQADAILAIMAAKKLNRPVKIAMTRQQVFFNATHRASTIQRLRLGASSDGKLTAIAHETYSQSTDFSKYTEQASMQTRSIYAGDNRLTTHRLVNLDIAPAGSVRAPGEAPGMLALEQAMDELAVTLDIDPIELRKINEPKEAPEKKIPFSTRQLIPCLEEGAKRFGWENRPKKPKSLRDKDGWLIGYGVASAYRSNVMQKSAAQVTLDKSGKLKVELAMTDIGTGTYTVLTQIAAETMGLPVDKVEVIMGDTDLPPAAGSGGSWGANSSGSGVYVALMKLREQIANAAVADKKSPLYDEDADDVTFEKATIKSGNKSESLADLAARSDQKTLFAKAEHDKPDTYKEYAQASYGAHFAEVGVHAVTGEIRMRRMLGVFAAGRILNEKTANSQAVGGMIWGIGAALHEGTYVDQRYGQFINHDLAEYHVPVHADIKNVEAVFLPEVDDKTGPLKIKGVGELGICGAGAAIANAVYNACGVRVRDYPITLDKILKELA